MKPKFVILPLFLFTLAFLGVRQSADLYRQSAATYFNQANLGSDDFRRMQPGTYVMEQLRTDAEQTGLSPGELLAIRLPFEHFLFWIRKSVDSCPVRSVAYAFLSEKSEWL